MALRILDTSRLTTHCSLGVRACIVNKMQNHWDACLPAFCPCSDSIFAATISGLRVPEHWGPTSPSFRRCGTSISVAAK